MREIIRFLQRYIFSITFIICLLVSLILLMRFNDYQRAVSNNFVNNFEGTIYEKRSDITKYWQLGTVNKNLAEENAMLRKMLVTSYRNYDIDTMAIDNLRTLYGRDFNNPENPNIFNFIPAEVIYNTTNYNNNKILIDKGKNDGIREGMGVISPTSVVGIVVKVTNNYASIMPVLHSNFRVGVKPISEKEYGTASWHGNDFRTGNVVDLPSHTRLKINDTIVTSGLSKIFPPNIPVGLVKNIKPKASTGVLDVDISFIDDYRKTTYVYVIDHIYSNQIDSLMH